MTTSGVGRELPDSPSPVIRGRHFPELDGLRGIAVLVVIWFHSRFIADPSTLAQEMYFAFAETGWIGVNLFFVLSGFLITGILIDTRGEPHWFRRFYQRRVLRIFPLYYLALLLTTLAAALFPGIDGLRQPSLLGKISYWLHFQNLLSLWGVNSTPLLAHFWSLAVEEQFYLVWPLAVLWTGTADRLGKLCLLIWGIAIVFRVVAINREMFEISFLTVSRLDGLVLGACAAAWFKRNGSLMPLQALAGRLVFYGGVTVMVLFAGLGQFYGSSAPVMMVGLPALSAFFAGMLVVALTARSQGMLRKVLRQRWLGRIGKISFGMYVMHPLVIYLLRHAQLVPTGNFWLVQFAFLVLVTAITTALAWLSYRYFETFFLRIKPGYDQ